MAGELSTEIMSHTDQAAGTRKLECLIAGGLIVILIRSLLFPIQSKFA